MTIAANRRSIMTLFADKNDIYCHQVKIVLAEKGVAYETENIEPGEISEDLLELNPTGSLPTLVDRDLVLFNSRIIMEYLDERFTSAFDAGVSGCKSRVSFANAAY